MSHIKSRKHPIKLGKSGSSLSGATLLTGMALSLPIASIAHAADDAAAPTGKAVELQKMTVVGEDQSGYKEDQVSSPKFTQPLQDTPQTIQIITSDLFNQQGATTLTEALRNTPGVGFPAPFPSDRAWAQWTGSSEASEQKLVPHRS